MIEDKYSHFVAECDSPKEEIIDFAKSKKIDPEELDFRLVEIYTYVKTQNDSQFSESKSEKLQNYLEKEYWGDKTFQIKQKYAITVVSKNREDACPIKMEIVSNKTKTKIDALIQASKNILKIVDIEKKLFEELIRKKVRFGLLVFDFDAKKLKEEIRNFIAQLKSDEELEEYTLPLCFIPEPKKTQNAVIRQLFKEKLKKEEHDRVDYRERGFLITVKEGEVIIEFFKPKKGESYRNCGGKYVEAEEPMGESKIDFNVDGTIRKEEDEDSVKFIANRNGYVKESENRISIDDMMEINEVSFKNTGSLKAGVDSGMVVRIDEDDSMKESIGEGLSLEVTEVHAAGNIGSGVNIKAQSVNIGGQTHKTSRIESLSANIAIHKGYVRAREVQISRLEGGVVEAEECSIEQVLSGTIRAKNITIEILHSHSHLYASHSIELDKIEGEENRLNIDPKAYYEERERIEEIEKENDAFQKELAKNERELANKISLINNNREAIETLKAKIIEVKAQKGNPSPILLKKITSYKKIIQDAKAIKAKIEETHRVNTELKSNLEALNKSVLDAKISLNDRWKGFNEIKFHLLEPNVTFSYRPEERDREVKLIQIDDGKYEVKGFA